MKQLQRIRFHPAVVALSFLIAVFLFASSCGNSGGGSGGSGGSSTSAPSGFNGIAYICNISANGTPATGTLHIEATLVTAAPGATGNSTMSENIPVSFPANGSAASPAGFKTNTIYKQGTWQITKAQVIGLTGLLPGLPRTVILPGGVGNPSLDFTGGSCPFP